MTIKRTLILGAFIGLVIGIIMFVVGPLIPAVSSISTVFYFIHWPPIEVFGWMVGMTHDRSNAGLYKFLACILCYWIVLGVLAGLGCRAILSWRRKSHVA